MNIFTLFFFSSTAYFLGFFLSFPIRLTNFIFIFSASLIFVMFRNVFNMSKNIHIKCFTSILHATKYKLSTQYTARRKFIFHPSLYPYPYSHSHSFPFFFSSVKAIIAVDVNTHMVILAMGVKSALRDGMGRGFPEH